MFSYQTTRNNFLRRFCTAMSGFPKFSSQKEEVGVMNYYGWSPSVTIKFLSLLEIPKLNNSIANGLNDGPQPIRNSWRLHNLHYGLRALQSHMWFCKNA